MLSTRQFVTFSTLCFVAFTLGAVQAQNQPRVRPNYGPKKPQVPAANRPQPTGQETEIKAGPPKGFEANPSQKINQMLDFWEQKTSGIKTFRANFTRWVYDPVFGPKTGQAKKITGGEVRYAAPDKGMIEETKVATFNAAKAKAGDKWPFDMKPGTAGEHWVCDGTSVYEINHQNKQLIETKLPAEMQGKAIAEGPLPFMFGAKAETIRAKYWIREIPRAKPTDPYHLEFVPKGRGESFSRVRVRLDAKEFMPEILEIHDLNNMGRSVYKFDDRRKDNVSDNVKAFWNSFVRPNAPRGYDNVTFDAGIDPLRQAKAPVNPKR